MQAVLVIWVLAWSLRASTLPLQKPQPSTISALSGRRPENKKRSYASEDLTAINLDQASGITVEGSMKEFPFVLNHVISESSLTGQKAELSTQLSEFMSTVMMFLERQSSEMSLLKEQVAKDRENLINLSLSVEILTHKVAGLNVEVDVMAELAREYRTISERLSTLERKEGTIADKDRFQQGCEGSALGQPFTHEDRDVFEEEYAFFKRMITGFVEESGEVSGEDIGEESQEGSGEDGETTFQGSRRGQSFLYKLPKVLLEEDELYDRVITDDLKESREGSGEESREESGKDDVYVKSRSVVLQPPCFAKGCLISMMAVTGDERLVMHDYAQKTLHMEEINGSKKFRHASLEESAGDMALLSNGLLAITLTNTKKIVFYNVSGDYLQDVGYVTTAIGYKGIAQVGDSEQLVVSHFAGDNFYSVDILNFRGQLTRHVRNGTDIRYPNHLSYLDGDVFISDWAANHLHRLNLATGELLPTTSTTRGQEVSLFQPRQSAVDDKGNLFLATGGTACSGLGNDDPYYWCVMLLARNGTWKKLTDVQMDLKSDHVYPYGVAVSGDHLYVSYANWHDVWSTQIIEYTLGYR